MNPALETIEAIVDLLRQLGWYYHVNDCQDRHHEDAIEVPIKDLRAAAELYTLMTGEEISGPSTVSLTCPGGIDPGFDECPKCGATMDDECRASNPVSPAHTTSGD